MHLYTSRLEDPEWDFGRDVEAPVIRQTLVRSHRWRRFEVRQKAKSEYETAKQGFALRHQTAGQASRDLYWTTRSRLELYWLRLKRQPRRLHPDRIRARFSRRTEARPHD